MKLYILILFYIVTLSSASAGEFGKLIFHDTFDRSESQELKDEPGNNWTTSSDKTAKGNKQIDLRDGHVYIYTHAEANHATSFRQAFDFQDGTIGLRVLFEDERDEIIGVQDLDDADALMISVRRRALPAKDLERIRRFVAQGKPVIGIRTANHAFSLRGKPTPEGKAVWDSFDADVFGGNYTNHFGRDLKTTLKGLESPDVNEHPVLAATDASAITPGGSLYKVAPLAPGARPLINGTVPGEQAEPVAWTFIRNDGGRSFYTSLGHPDDFDQPEFESLLAAGIHWACGLTPQSLSEIKSQNTRYANGGGKQR